MWAHTFRRWNICWKRSSLKRNQRPTHEGRVHTQAGGNCRGEWFRQKLVGGEITRRFSRAVRLRFAGQFLQGPRANTAGPAGAGELRSSPGDRLGGGGNIFHPVPRGV